MFIMISLPKKCLIVTEKCWNCDWNLFVKIRLKLWRSCPITIFCDGKLWRSVKKILWRKLRRKISFVTKIVTGNSVTMWKKSSGGKLYLGLWRGIVTNSVTICDGRWSQWPSLFGFCDGFLWWNSITIWFCDRIF